MTGPLATPAPGPHPTGDATTAPPGAVAMVGCVNVDVLVREVSELPPPGTDHHVQEVSVRAAGPVLNVGFVLHALGDGPAVCYGTIGDDPLARLVLAECEAYGVPTQGLRQVAGSRTAVSVALESTGRSRSFLTDLAAAALLDESALPGSFAGCSDVLLGGYFCVPALRGEPTARTLRRARAAGARTWLDCGWDPGSWSGGAVDEVLDLVAETDVFVPNVDEVLALTAETDPVRGGSALAERARLGVIVKAGADGAYWIPREGGPVHVPAPAVAVVDTTGAGDALNAGVIAGLRRGHDMIRALRLGVRVASTVVSRTSERRWERFEHDPDPQPARAASTARSGPQGPSGPSGPSGAGGRPQAVDPAVGARSARRASG